MKKLIIFLSFFITSQASALGIKEAYKAIPHAQTPFHVLQSNMSDTEARYVSRLLSLSELAMVERVEAMKNGPENAHYERDIADILKQLSSLETPQKLRAVYDHIYQAIQQQRSYFTLHNSRDKKQQKQLIQGSHHHLITAYNMLMKLYPNESKHNQRAFFDYLCALDFI
jgi:hypothetical protein